MNRNQTMEYSSPFVLKTILYLLAQVSTVYLNFNRADFFSKAQSNMNTILFVTSFFLCRVVFGPWSIWQHVKILYSEEAMSEKAQRCSPNGFRHIIFLTGIFFTVLNYFWFYKILRKVYRKITGKSRSSKQAIVDAPMTNGSMHSNGNITQNHNNNNKDRSEKHD